MACWSLASIPVNTAIMKLWSDRYEIWLGGELSLFDITALRSVIHTQNTSSVRFPMIGQVWFGRSRFSSLPAENTKDHVISSVPGALGSYNVYSVYSATILDHHRQLFKD